MGWTKLSAIGASVLVVLAGCSGDGSGGARLSTDETTSESPSATADPTPSLGGSLETPAKAPSKPMDGLERPIASRLAAQVADQGLSLDYLECPRWNGKAPLRLTCRGYLDRVIADVRVRLTKSTTRVNFDAELLDGVFATANLVRRLKSDGYTGIDCGDEPAYPAVAGTELVCEVGSGGNERYVVATILDRSGRRVRIRDY